MSRNTPGSVLTRRVPEDPPPENLMTKEGEQPQPEIARRKTPPEDVRAPVHPEQLSHETSGHVIFDRLTAMQGQLQQIDQKLQMHTDLVRELAEVRAERDQLVQEAQARQARELKEAEAERDRLKREAEAERDRQAQERERQAQEAQAKQRRKQDLSNARTRDWRNKHPEQVMQRRRAERARQRKTPS